MSVKKPKKLSVQFYEKSRFSHRTRIDPEHIPDIQKEEGKSFAQKLDKIICKGLGLWKK